MVGGSQTGMASGESRQLEADNKSAKKGKVIKMCIPTRSVAEEERRENMKY